jgi:hypothetical protein
MNHRADKVFGKTYEFLPPEEQIRIRDEFINTRMGALQAITKDPTKTIADLV